MTVKNKLGLIARVGATAALATGLAVAFQPAAMAAAPVVTVTPATGLTDGATVAVTGTGLTPGAIYHVAQCELVTAGSYGCDPASVVNIAADAQGKLTTQITVHASFAAVEGAEGTPAGTVDCKVSACQVGLGDDAGVGGGQQITFK
ncbi:enediyne antibiotic chromoprotein [Streptomyces antarcticus]|uniref:enediyne antibiotic chromoprotein n=1 Tax=Streptomyces antarcticus TaxID=2996458 RepID=UPI00226DF44D|nr:MULTISPECIES: enediyne antibiotic chromoprotein [unclassified Streptomyces]MCY0942962.1 enediyne antibiotic chromoprotein [Streptomyces sp. H34-AA3]MCY0952991.1 enediyne antibiotic chromoprotein [Streptomyces sp. H27-S2]MCZ4083078.1 enediyne antibiotic chromoprotein [Streptomyces sp. H34-S5]